MPCAARKTRTSSTAYFRGSGFGFGRWRLRSDPSRTRRTREPAPPCSAAPSARKSDASSSQRTSERVGRSKALASARRCRLSIEISDHDIGRLMSHIDTVRPQRGAPHFGSIRYRRNIGGTRIKAGTPGSSKSCASPTRAALRMRRVSLRPLEAERPQGGVDLPGETHGNEVQVVRDVLCMGVGLRTRSGLPARHGPARREVALPLRDGQWLQRLAKESAKPAQKPVASRPAMEFATTV